MNLLIFVLLVGGLATAALDIWMSVSARLRHKAPADWGLVGRWLRGLPAGRLVLEQTDTRAPGATEYALGWGFHYFVGFAYAAILPLIWGRDYIGSPTLGPALVIGVGLTTLAGLTILMPGMGGGILARKTPAPLETIATMIGNHVVFALAMFAFARLASRLLGF